MPREDAAPTCRRSRHHDAAESAAAGCRFGTNPNVANHVADAIRLSRNSEKIASVGIDIISNFAQHFASLMDPFGVTMDAASANAVPTQQPPAAPAAGNSTQTNNTTQTTDAAAAPNATAAAPATTSTPNHPKTTIPAGTSRMPDMVYIEDDLDDYVTVPGPTVANESNDSNDSVAEALMEASKEAKNGPTKRQNLDFD